MLIVDLVKLSRARNVERKKMRLSDDKLMGKIVKICLIAWSYGGAALGSDLIISPRFLDTSSCPERLSHFQIQE